MPAVLTAGGQSWGQDGTLPWLEFAGPYFVGRCHHFCLPPLRTDPKAAHKGPMGELWEGLLRNSGNGAFAEAKGWVAVTWASFLSPVAASDHACSSSTHAHALGFATSQKRPQFNREAPRS